MSRLYIPKHFRIEELVYPGFYEAHKHRDNLIWLAFDVRVLKTADRLRERYGKMTVNNWCWGGDRTESGLRAMNTSTGAALSQHKFGRALDCIFHDCTAEEVRADMRKEEILEPNNMWGGQPCFDLITCIEEFPGMSWFHFDVRNRDTNKYGVKVVGK
ncbi:peptidase M15 [Maridesulfovibrio sp.]|uniref:peptidase M15 n=1 Tax=Maridesulfovibrio sp. TaxID=2795000 RepID=UPI0029CA6828|nr:peptidase M15 [Maridesulfovibrio sp.]